VEEDGCVQEPVAGVNHAARELDEKRPGQVSVDNRRGPPRPRAEHQCAEAEEEEPRRDDVQAGRQQRPETDPAVLAGGARPGPDPGQQASRDEEKTGESQPPGEPRRTAKTATANSQPSATGRIRRTAKPAEPPSRARCGCDESRPGHEAAPASRVPASWLASAPMARNMAAARTGPGTVPRARAHG